MITIASKALKSYNKGDIKGLSELAAVVRREIKIAGTWWVLRRSAVATRLVGGLLRRHIICGPSFGSFITAETSQARLIDPGRDRVLTNKKCIAAGLFCVRFNIFPYI
jgi:hypothetical protein